MITPRSRIKFDAQVRKYVHARCAVALSPAFATPAGSAPSRKRRRAPAPAPIAAKRFKPGLVHGLKPGTLETYHQEWDKYVRFALGRGFTSVPGRDCAWDLGLLNAYMRWRANTNKPSSLARIFSILTHFGTMTGFLLANCRFDNDSLTYRRLGHMKKQLALDHVAKSGGVVEAPNRCAPLDKRCVEILFSTFGATSRAGFAGLRRVHRHHLVASIMQHCEGMRFGHFVYRQYKIQDFHVDGRDGSFRLMTDWHRFSGRALYRLSFDAFPAAHARRYELHDMTGAIIDTVSPATVLSWHFQLLRAAGEDIVFAPIQGAAPSHESRTRWLRDSLRRAIPARETAARALISEVTPHSFRPGLAGDLLREGMRLEEIARRCRWQGTRNNARMYSNRPPLSSFLRSPSFSTLAYHF